MYVYFLILLKTVFILLAIYEAYLKKIGSKKDNETIEFINYWKGRCEFIFIIGVAIILIITFTPLKPKMGVIDYETRLLFYFLGWILLITAKWSEFFDESRWFHKIQEIVSLK